IPGFERLSKLSLAADTNKLLNPALSPDGQWLAAGLSRREVGLWNLSVGKFTRLTSPVPQAGLAMALAFSPDGRQLAASFMDTTAIHVWNLSSGTNLPLTQLGP